jgi:hypothetical protein
MKDLSALFAAELSKKTEGKANYPIEKTIRQIEKPTYRGIRKLTGFENRGLVTLTQMPTPPKPETILQLNSTPFAIDVNQYRNPHSADNPTGDYKAAYRLTRLADPIPELSTYYSSSLQSAENIWGNIVNYATSQSAYTKNLLNEAQLKYNTSKMVGMGGFIDDWFPVYAIPSNWFDIVGDEKNLMRMEIDMINGDTYNDDFLIVNGGKAISLNIISKGKGQSQINLNPNTTIKKIFVDVLRVDFIRPWLNFEILNLRNWKIDGLEREYYSNGNLDENNGIFPLVTKSMLIGAKISFEGDFDPHDINLLSKQTAKRNNLSIGPFLLNTSEQCLDINNTKQNTIITSSIKQIIGYISQLIPESPPES